MDTLFNALGLTRTMVGSRLGDGTPLSGKDVLDVINPSDETVLGTVSLMDAQHYDRVLDIARQAALQWRDVPAPVRGQVVRALRAEIASQHEHLAKLISLEMGKPLVEARGEVQEMLDMADVAIGLSRSLAGQTLVSERTDHRLQETWQPLGVIGIITAFNFPMAVWAWNAMLACICGNSVIWKPSHHVPFCALAIQQICEKVQKQCQTPAIWNLMMASNDVAERMVADPQVALISFTGSTSVGRQVASTVASRLGKVLLELGGNNAVIVDETANLDLAVPALVFGAIGTSGQRCTTTRRIIVHQQQYEPLVERLCKAYAQVKIGDPLYLENHVGPLVSAAAVQLYQDALSRLKQLGSHLLTGDEVLVRPGFFVKPTLATAKPDWPIWQEEVFVPITLITTYQDFDEAIALQNQVPQGLSSALFTEQLRHAEQFLSARGSDCGLANINTGTSGAEIGGAFGGEKATGGGREAGSDAWKAYMRRQTSVINWSQALPLAQGIVF